MSQYEDKPGDGVLFKNKDKKNDKHPDYKGTWTNADGEKCGIAAWLRESQKTGTKFMSLKIELHPYNQSRPSEPESQDNGPDDDVPF